jgi:hypothetical protein
MTNQTKATAVALFGAGGTMGAHLTLALKDDPDLALVYVDPAEHAQESLATHGLTVTPPDVACRESDVVILAVPDTLVGRIASDVVPALKSGTLVITLDPAAPHAGRLPDRPDVSYFVTHPAYPSLFNDEATLEARRDYLATGLAKQAIVNALLQGSDEDYARGDALARKMWRPVLRSHRVTVEQMAILEPGLSETVLGTCLTVLREALDETVRRGVPEQAARDFLLGHMYAEAAIVFGEIEGEFSEAAQKAIAAAKKTIIKDDWLTVFEPENLLASVHAMTSET